MPDCADLSSACTAAPGTRARRFVILISGRKAFQRPFKEGAALLQSIQDVYLNKDITIA